MFAPALHRLRRGFTLLEVMIATMIIAMLALTIYSFLTTNLKAIRISTELGDEREAMQAVVRLVQMQLNSLPQYDSGVLGGQPLKFHGLSADELTWQTGPGPGLLTTAADGDYRVTLTVQPVSERSSETELGLRRWVSDQKKSPTAKDYDRGGGSRKYNWLPLVRPMAAFEVRYFNQDNGQWVDSWTDNMRRPSLLRIRLWKRAEDPPEEAILPVPSSRVQQPQ